MTYRKIHPLVWGAFALVGFACLVPQEICAQWQNRYPRVAGYGHHVYLEGYELPFLASGPVDPAPAPDGRRLAFSARGWIWVMDLETRVAHRLTSGREMDFRPAWHPDGNQIAFVRDNNRDTEIVVLDVESGRVLHVINTPTIELDPAYSADGRRIYYTSGQAGSLDIWSVEMEGGPGGPGEPVRRTEEPGIEVRPQPLASGEGFVVLAKRGGDRVELRTPGAGPPRALAAGSILSMTRPALAPDGSLLALAWPSQNGWSLQVHGVARPGVPVLLASGRLALTPAWSPDGKWVYFAGSDDTEVMSLKRVRSVGGPVEAVGVDAWDWQTDVARVRVRTRLAGSAKSVPARLNVTDGDGHPAVPDKGAAHFDGSSGRVFFYSPGVTQVTVPAGEVTVSAVQGLATPEQKVTVVARAGHVTDVEVDLEPVWDARGAGWAAGDHHFHLNYGGQYDLTPSDMVLKMQGEALDMATPLLANLHNRYEDQGFWGWEKADESPFIRFGQEVRSHFLGHVALIETPEIHWPWVWGPGYEIYGSDDRTNGEVLSFAHDRGGIGYYVHPVSVPDPFASNSGFPVELVADAVLGDVDALEIMCLWSSFEGTAALWYRFLNVGIPVAPSAGTDVMLNLYRTMAVGATRVYVQVGDRLNWPGYIAGLREGRSFVTNGPFLDLRVREDAAVGEEDVGVRGVGPGGTIPGNRAVSWSLDLRSAIAVDSVEIVVNGEVVHGEAGLTQSGKRSYAGSVDLPAGGWIAARARGGTTAWPSMDTSPYAHTAPVWIGQRGSTDEDVRRTAADELLQLLAAARARLLEGYGDIDIPRLTARFDTARAKLEALAASSGTGRL